MNKTFFLIILSIILFISCDEEAPLTQNEIEYSNKAKILLDMDENSVLTVSVDNFDPVSIMSITIGYDKDILSAKTFKNGKFDNLFNTSQNALENSSEFIFENVSGDGILFTLSFEASGSFEGVTISAGDIVILSSNGEPLYMQCTNSQYEDNRSCRNAGYVWGPNKEEFIVQTVCYIDEGIIIQVTENSGEPFSDWEKTGNFVWYHGYCYGVDWD